MIVLGKFERAEPAIKALQKAMVSIGADSRLRPEGRPGEIIENLPSSEREALKDLTADMINKYRVESWQLFSGRGWSHRGWMRETIQKFDAEIFRHRKVEI